MIKQTLNAAALSGAIAALPLSLMVEVTQNILNKNDKSWKKVGSVEMDEPTTKAVEKSLQKQKSKKNPMLLSQYFSYGMAAGSFFPLYRSFFPKRMSARSRIYLGASYGFLVWYSMHKEWFHKYENIHAPQKKEITHNILQMSAHMIWGTALGFCYEVLKQDPKTKNQAKPRSLLSGSIVKAPNIHEQKLIH